MTALAVLKRWSRQERDLRRRDRREGPETGRDLGRPEGRVDRWKRGRREPPAPDSERAWSATFPEVDNVPVSDVDAELARWGAEARYHYAERLGIGLDLELDKAAAERVARLEARRVDAGVPLDWPEGAVDLALEVFRDFGMELVDVEDLDP